ncbi:MAG: protein kinase [Myxococcota bacterium]|nr:protein kinase [Myxococcota bacterium]
MSASKLGVGEIVDGRYRIERVLGEGGMGAVFVAEHLRLRKSVALKVVHGSFAGSAELAERFAREAMVSAKLEHPNVASAIDYGTLADGSAYLVMQLAPGKNLRAWLDDGTDWRFAVQVGAQIADALVAAHAIGVVHRDLKPENVMVDERVQPRVLDFGIARVTEAGTSVLTRVGTVMGTPGYMPPEQAVGEPVDARADVYALGVILYELCTGALPYPQDELGKILAAQLTADPPRLSMRVPDVPPELDALVAAMLASSKHARPSDVGPIRDSLRAMAHALGPVPRVTATAARAPSEATSATPSPDATIATPPSPSEATIATPPPPSEATIATPPPGSTMASSSSTGSATIGTPAPAAVPARDSQPVALAPTMIAPAPRPAPSPPLPMSAFLAMGALTVLVVSCLGVRSACGGDDAPEAVTAVSAGAAGPIGDVPAELALDVTTLITSPDAATRSGAAARLIPHQAQLPPFARMLLSVETSAECEDRRDAVRALRVLGDPRALPTLYRLARDAERDDRCLRRDVQRAIERLAR